MTAGEVPQALGHQLIHFSDRSSGVVAHCECGETFWGRWTTAAAKAWAIHSTEEARNSDSGDKGDTRGIG